MATLKFGTWHTARGGGRTSNATLEFEGSRIAASFIVFKRDLEGVPAGSVTDVLLEFYVDDQLASTTSLTWNSAVAAANLDAQEAINQDIRFVHNLVFFNNTVAPGKRVFRVQYNPLGGGRTERDTSLALDYFEYVPLVQVAVPPSDPTPTTPIATARSTTDVGKIIGPIVGVFAVLISVGCGLFFWWRKRSKQRRRTRFSTFRSGWTDGLAKSPPPTTVAPLSGITHTSPTPSSRLSFTTLSSLSIFSRPGMDLQGFGSPDLGEKQHSRSLRTSTISASLSYTSYEQQWQGFSMDASGRIVS
ncbi:hypothetical protein CC1G_03721 [Coprinopsis cinerea okayama7|uniref:Uncharacterized protein n=1 Tax=Coprinopsis cinerea (strain Okayama-7 / 130 / ATCC MYA-4618 / FGSC 9003) TaxID=240176 RepID=A8N228_COPC7|nr:hypothetical protein CC1G_03721 [Coprinopsis cinerea okayama7\|eukprot:XP_001828927.2 hypothetical protein CC1G_03721 [Coprinopsis cinerea okayama7\